MDDILSRRPTRHAFTALDLKSVAEDGTFEGYASLFDTEDLGGDVIAPGAFSVTLNKRGPARVKMLFQHDPAQPIGIWTALAEDARGLTARGRLMTEVVKAREVHALMRAGALDGLSIGFRSVKGQRDPRTGIRRLTEIDLWEISIVTFPMHPEARIASFKSRPFSGPLPTEREFERWLRRDAGLTRREARAITRNGLQGLAALRDAGGADQIEQAIATRLRMASHLLRS